MDTFRTIIDLWGTGALADELGKKPETVRKWRTRNSIPAGEWDGVVRNARKHGFHVTHEQLSQIAAKIQHG